MNEIGKKLKELRKKKGLSQEELADLASVNLRTIQRIESNESEPRGNTLNQICKILNVNAEEILDYGKQTDNSYLFFFHLSVLSFLVIPLGNIILPMILWQTKKDKVTGLYEAGINLLNYQLAWTVLSFLTLMTFAFLKIMHVQYCHLLLYAYIGLYLLNVILPVYLSYKSKRGATEIKYPKVINLIH